MIVQLTLAYELEAASCVRLASSPTLCPPHASARQAAIFATGDCYATRPCFRWCRSLDCRSVGLRRRRRFCLCPNRG
jgi:hypothetical protein